MSQDVGRTPIMELRHQGKRLGRHIQHDPRSRDFQAQRAPKIVSVNHQAQGLPLDQGDIGSCTANALCAARNSVPNRLVNDKILTETDAVALYECETANEGQPYPPNDPGGTGLEVCKAAQQLGLISSYTHAFGLQHALEALVVRPVIFGVNWYSGFDRPTTSGRVKLTGYVRGGHEICADEIQVSSKLVGFWNSWGAAYGLGGRFYMTFSTLDRLLREQGDATVPIR